MESAMRGISSHPIRGLSLALAFALIGAFTLEVGDGSSHRFKGKSRVTINRAGEVFSGKVRSRRPFCRRRRKVSLLRVDNAGYDSFHGGTISGRRGRWKIRATTMPPGRYYAFVSAKSRLTQRHRHACRRAFSRMLTVP